MIQKYINKEYFEPTILNILTHKDLNGLFMIEKDNIFLRMNGVKYNIMYHGEVGNNFISEKQYEIICEDHIIIIDFLEIEIIITVYDVFLENILDTFYIPK